MKALRPVSAMRFASLILSFCLGPSTFAQNKQLMPMPPPGHATAATPAPIGPPEDQGPRTEVKGHQMGETAAEFYIKSGYGPFIEQCRSVAENQKQVKKLHCEGTLSGLAGGTIRTTDPNWASESERENKKRLRENYGVDPSPENTAILSGGRLARVDLMVGPFAYFLPSLVEKYGKPSSISSDTLQNAFGAKFEVGRAKWTMPDGTIISATEELLFTSGYQRYTNIEFDNGTLLSSSPLPANPF